MKTTHKLATLSSILFQTRLPACTPLLLACVGLLLCQNAKAWQINFDYADYGYPTYGPGPAATGAPGDLWNTATVCMSRPNLTLADGTPTTLSWNVSSGAGWGVNASQLRGPYANLRDIASIINTASITGLTPNQPYQLYVYANRLNPEGPNNVTVNGVDFLASAFDWQMDELLLGQQYDTHTVIADSTGSLVFTPNSGQANVASWQLVEIPEPSCLGLGLLMLATLLGSRRLNGAPGADSARE